MGLPQMTSVLESCRTGVMVPNLERTPPQIMGPFYPVTDRPDSGGDLACPADRPSRARGQLIYVTGRVLTCSGRPVEGARIEVWHANADGKYRHPSDVNPAAIDPNFDGFGLLMTDAAGRYRLRTVKPGRYPTVDGEIRPPHIHFDVQGRFDRLVTQLYFAGEPENHTDRWLQAAPRPDLLIAALDPALPQLDPEARVAVFDIVLPSG
jgi:protocatechuate 3,4-dioxygenase, beta subunit